MAEEFGFELEFIHEVNGLAGSRGADAIFLDMSCAHSRELLRTGAVQRLAPQARLVISHPMSASDGEIAEVSAFHSLPQPLHPGEVRQSLAFLYSALAQEKQNAEGDGSEAADASALDAPVNESTTSR